MSSIPMVTHGTLLWSGLDMATVELEFGVNLRCERFTGCLQCANEFLPVFGEQLLVVHQSHVLLAQGLQHSGFLWIRSAHERNGIRLQWRIHSYEFWLLVLILLKSSSKFRIGSIVGLYFEYAKGLRGRIPGLPE